MSHDALRTIVPVAGWGEDRAKAVEITGGPDPILPTPFRIGETSAAALAAVGLAVSDLWALRTGRGQEVGVDTRQATASLRSGHYMQMDGAHVSTERNTVMGVYPARNGRWSYLHCNFPNHRAAALMSLGIAVMQVFLRIPIPLYGTLGILIWAFVINYLPYGMRYASSGMLQIHR